MSLRAPRAAAGLGLAAAFVLLAATGAARAEDRPGEEELFGAAPAEVPAVAPGAEAPPPAAEASLPGAADGPTGRPSEDELFAAPTPTSASAPTASPEPARARVDEYGRPTEDAMFGAGPPPPQGPVQSAQEIIPEDPLKIGGQFYTRAYTTMSAEADPERWGFSVPTLLDGYMDARPNERVRGFMLARLAYDPMVPDAAGTSTAAAPFASAQKLSLSLDQLWLRFDIARVAYFTVGRQHIKWGPAHFWNPTDFLHNVRRDPLAPFDARVGSTMLKVQIPWEKLGWNLYAVGLFEDAIVDGTLGNIGGGLRAEIVLGPAEIGAEALFQKGHRPRLGADLSAGVGPVDVYAEAALRKGWEPPLFRFAQAADPAAGRQVETWQENDYTVQAAGGLSWSLSVHDINVLTVGAEYFFNSVGYEDKALYPYLLANGAFTPFYAGRHYLGVYGMLNTPASFHNLSVVLSNVGNLSDRSFVARLDVSVIVLTHLRVEAYTAWHYGHRGGEFRFGGDLPAIGATPAVSVPAPLAEVGLGLRINI